MSKKERWTRLRSRRARARWQVGLRVSRRDSVELGTVVEVNGKIKVKWDSGSTSYFLHGEDVNVKRYRPLREASLANRSVYPADRDDAGKATIDRDQEPVTMICPSCGATMRLVGIERDSGNTNLHLLTFECAREHIAVSTYPN